MGYAEYYLAKSQMNLGVDVKILCSNRSVNNGKKLLISGSLNIDGMSVSRLNSELCFRGDIWLFNPIRFEAIVRDFSPDVVYCRGLLAPLSQEVMFLKKKYGFSIVGDLVTGSGTDTFSQIADVSTTLLLKHILRYWFLSNVDAFCVCSGALEKWLQKSLKFPKYKTFFVPLGADHKLFRPDLRIKSETRALLGISPNDVVAIYTGKLLPSKRIHDFLIAGKKVITKHKNFKILLVGDGAFSYETRLKSLIDDLGVSSNVIRLKTVHRKLLNNYYNVADFAVWPGGFSISMIEAMSSGLPLIIPKSDWTNHYLEYENGFSFSAGNVEELSSLIGKIVENPELRQSLASKSRKLVEDKLNWDSIAKKHVEIYKSCIDRQRL